MSTRGKADKPRKRRIWWLLGAALALAVTLSWGSGWLAWRSVDAKLARARANGFPVEPEDVFLGGKVADADNAAAIYDQITRLSADLRVDVPREEENAFADFARGETGADLVLARRHLERNRALIALGEQAAQRPHWFPDKDWSNPATVMYAEYADMKKLTKLFVGRALFAAQRGEINLAIDDLERALAMATHAQELGVMIGHLVSYANQAILLRGVEIVVSSPGVNDEHLERLIALVDQWPRQEDISHVLRIEAYFSTWIPRNVDVLYEDYMTPWKISDGVPSSNDEWWNFQMQFPSVQAHATELCLDYWAEAIDTYDPTDDDLAGWAFRMDRKRPEPKAWNDGAEALASIGVAGLEMFARSTLQAKTIPYLLESALKIARNPNVDPSTFLNDDPCGTGPLVFKRTAKGFIVYGVGRDAKDDGGISRRDPITGGQDIVFEHPYTPFPKSGP